MRFTIIGHACLLVEHGDTRLVVDPWLLGSCYWRSWWQHPPARDDLVRPADVSAIYYTHEHPDHLHYPSLRRFPDTIRILVPRFPVERTATFIRERGFRRVEEIPHAGDTRVGTLSVHSYQYGLDDSIVVVSDGETTLVNLNDAKASGLTLRLIRRRHPRVDFLLRSHAPAQAYPFCYSAEDERDLTLLQLHYYTNSFSAAVRVFQPRWAIPFASSVCHLHPESRAQNAFMVSPEAVVEACAGRIGRAEIVPMHPGDSWSRSAGFSRGAVAPASLDEASVNHLVARNPGLARYIEEESAIAPIDAATLAGYLEGFVRSVPRVLRHAYPARVAFEISEPPNAAYVVVDLGRVRIDTVRELPSGLHSHVRANAHLLRDAVDKRCLNLVGISKRLRVHLYRGGVVYDAAFWGLLAVHELGYLPARRILTVRAIGVLAARWRELAAYARAFIRPSRSLESILETWEPR